jgi:aryl-alcohol dehydrogenase-like predicted oxidoreductase
VPIPGTRRRSRLDENIRAVSLVLTSDDLARLDEIAPKGAAAGTRYAAEAMAGLNR